MAKTVRRSAETIRAIANDCAPEWLDYGEVDEIVNRNLERCAHVLRSAEAEGLLSVDQIRERALAVVVRTGGVGDYLDAPKPGAGPPPLEHYAAGLELLAEILEYQADQRGAGGRPDAR